MSKLNLAFYVIISSLFFIISLKFSGAEAYHHSGFATYFKWVLLSMVVNVGFLIQFLRPTGWKKGITILFMLLAFTINIMIYANPKSWVLYDLLSISLLFLSIYLVIKGAFSNGKNLYA